MNRSEINFIPSKKGSTPSELQFKKAIENLTAAFLILSPVKNNNLITDFTSKYIKNAGSNILQPEKITGKRFLESFPQLKESISSWQRKCLYSNAPRRGLAKGN